MDKKNSLKNICIAALFAALIFTATAVFPIPLGIGYANLGDCFVIIAGVFLNPVYAVLAAGLGSALSDIVLSYTLYAPATFIIKGLMALLTSLLLRKNKGFVKTLLVCIAAEVIMIGGYLVFELFLYGKGAFLSLAGNSLQAAVGVVSSIILIGAIRKIKK